MPTAVSTDRASEIAAKFRAIIDHLDGQLVERRTELTLLALALVSRTHIILHGEPGNAKTMTVERFLAYLDGVALFKTQAFKGSVPEQFLGPISVKGMAEDEYRRIVRGKFADSHVTVIDELPRAPRSILPAFQGGMVERTFDNGDGPVPIPLMTFIGTSNHLLDDDELAAFFDRFTWRTVVKGPSSQESFKDIMRLSLGRRTDPKAARVGPDMSVALYELELLQAHAATIEVPDDVLDALGELWDVLLAQGINPSVRRYDDLLRGLQAAAALRGDDVVSIDDVMLAQHSLWTSEAEIPIVYGEVVKFASEWVRETAALLDTAAELRVQFAQLQAMAPVDISTARNTAIGVASDGRGLAGLIDKQIAAATGGDVKPLENALANIAQARAWISDKLMGGLTL